MILRSKKTIGMPLKYKKRSTKVSSHISSPQAKNIPDEVIKIVLDYLDFKDPINKIYNPKKCRVNYCTQTYELLHGNNNLLSKLNKIF